MFTKATINRCLFCLVLSTQFLQCNNGQPLDSIPNLSFEEWEEGSLQDDPFLLADPSHQIPDAKVGNLYGWSAFGQSAVRTTDAYSGDFALVVNSWYGTGPGVVDLGQCKVNHLSQACGMPFKGHLSKLRGYYKLFEGATYKNKALQGHIAVWTFRFNQTTGQRDTVAFGEIRLEPSGEYAPFEFEVHTFLDNTVSDSIAVILRVDGSDCQNGKCNYFYLDELQLEGGKTTAALYPEKESNDLGLAVFPNPFTQNLIIQNTKAGAAIRFRLLDGLGQILSREHELSASQVVDWDMGNRAAGLYFLEVKRENLSYILKLVKH